MASDPALRYLLSAADARGMRASWSGCTAWFRHTWPTSPSTTSRYSHGRPCRRGPRRLQQMWAAAWVGRALFSTPTWGHSCTMWLSCSLVACCIGGRAGCHIAVLVHLHGGDYLADVGHGRLYNKVVRLGDESTQSSEATKQPDAPSAFHWRVRVVSGGGVMSSHAGPARLPQEDPATATSAAATAMESAGISVPGTASAAALQRHSQSGSRGGCSGSSGGSGSAAAGVAEG